MEGLTEIPEKMTAAEFEELYARAVSRLRGQEIQAVQDPLEATIRAVVRDDLAKTEFKERQEGDLKAPGFGA